MNLAPIVLFVYNRADHTKQTVEALKKNRLAKESELFIFSDAPKNENSVGAVNEVREYIKKIDGFKNIIIKEAPKNKGLANSVIAGVTEIVNKYEKVIVLEDDLVTSPYFLEYMNENLNFYEKEDRVASIHGYVYPIKGLPNRFFLRGSDCWGWATWKRAWDIFEKDGQKLFDELKQNKFERLADFNGSYNFTKMLTEQIAGKNNSWAIRWYMSTFLKDMVTLYPGKSYVENIGNDNSGTHCGRTNLFHVELNETYVNEKIIVQENIKNRKKFEDYFLSIKRTIFQRLKLKLKRLIS